VRTLPLLCLLAGWPAWADSGNAEAYAAVARGDYAAARKTWAALAKQGDAEAQYNLGVMYANGDGGRKDLPAALKWFRVAASAGHAQAQYNLGVMYANGEGVRHSGREAANWLQQSAGQGLAKAQYSLGLLYEEGLGGEPDLAEAQRWYRKAAEQGDADSQRRLETLQAAPEQAGGEASRPAVSTPWDNRPADVIEEVELDHDPEPATPSGAAADAALPAMQQAEDLAPQPAGRKHRKKHAAKSKSKAKTSSKAKAAHRQRASKH
jgi:TPR repeat protein